ncbi:MAG: glycosyltransferase [Candidatus Marinimicrobia bacterium]|jgi:glycosyltransferase involved in cell wall biosynthesis|nr:glycosyltransferase [Candidatus Neomarinimicrobiota bacterium]MBT4660394.1 glycosyltransferase [Candidatus Neomarinimicrobiota bacterium]MBT5224130.1 glycosyltransferase [Candidatus Neomarinimicrobiota bacterium]MBT6710881.1 glycosyltransferase [Candidatus Neomarinimicrobiota bacterium]MBT7372635.1 glycosyltransferase [Candidatus Neomarinimicrobiota bacterium]
MFYSIIIPVYNRPDHIQEVLECLVDQSFKDFEVIIVESGSPIKSDKVVESFQDKLKIRYYFKGNDGQGFSRNYGMARAEGEYFIIFDSDLIIPSTYMQTVDNSLKDNSLDVYGGPDKAHSSFTMVQKAVDFVLTSFITTGGSRGGANSVGKYRPRSFNMGISKKVFEATKGYLLPFLGEDIEFSIRIEKLGFNSGLIEEAFVYHKRKESLLGFYQQMHFFGRARININRFHKGNINLIHLVPLAFLGYLCLLLISLIWYSEDVKIVAIPLMVHASLILTTATVVLRNPITGVLTLVAAYCQLIGYGLGLITEVFSNSNPLDKSKI